MNLSRLSCPARRTRAIVQVLPFATQGVEHVGRVGRPLTRRPADHRDDDGILVQRVDGELENAVATFERRPRPPRRRALER
jgi:hypothetical protein